MIGQESMAQKMTFQNMYMNIYTPNIPSLKYSLAAEEEEMKVITAHILNLRIPEKRQDALNQLSKKRQTYPGLAPLLWYSVGTIAILLQELIQIYPDLSPPRLNQHSSNRVCLVLGLLQCMALHSEIRHEFLNAHIPLFLYPFLNTSIKSKVFEHLRVTSLGVIGALVKGDDFNAINFLMQTEIIPLCLRIMKRGNQLSKTVATFIVQKILVDENGLNYICQTAERFYAVSTVLNTMLQELVTSKKQDPRLIKHIMRCYLRLSQNKKACEALKKNVPEVIRNVPAFLLVDDSVKKWYNALVKNLFETDAY